MVQDKPQGKAMHPPRAMNSGNIQIARFESASPATLGPVWHGSRAELQQLQIIFLPNRPTPKLYGAPKLWSCSSFFVGVLEHLFCSSRNFYYGHRHGVGLKLPTIATHYTKKRFVLFFLPRTVALPLSRTSSWPPPPPSRAGNRPRRCHPRPPVARSAVAHSGLQSVPGRHRRRPPLCPRRCHP